MKIPTSFSALSYFTFTALTVVLAVPASLAQTLNSAVNAQLEADDDNNACALLLGGDPLSVLGDAGLREICGRFVGSSGNPSSTAGGGFATTPPSAPAAVEERMERPDEDDDGPYGGRGFFFSLAQDRIDKGVTTFEDGYNSDVVRLAAGLDRLFGDSTVLGFAVDGARQKGDFVDGGNFEISTLGVTGFGSLSLGQRSAFEFYAGIARLSNDRTRRASFVETEDNGSGPFETFRRESLPVSDYDADKLIAGFQLSYDWSVDNFSIGPRLRYDWAQTDYDTYSEIDSVGLGLRFHDDEEISSQLAAGLVASVALSTNFGVVLLDQGVYYRHESDMDQRAIQVSFIEDTRAKRFSYVTENPDRQFLQLVLGATFVLPDGVQVLAEYRAITSHRFLNVSTVTFGFRKEF